MSAEWPSGIDDTRRSLRAWLMPVSCDRGSLSLCSPAVTVHFQSDAELLVEAGPALIRVVDGGETRRDRADLVCDCFDEMLTRYPGVAFVVVFEHGSPIPDPATLRYIRERFDAYGDRVVVAVVAAGLGFWSSALLRVAAAFARVARHTVVISNSVEQASQRLAMELVGLDAGELLVQCEGVRAQLAAGRQSTHTG